MLTPPPRSPPSAARSAARTDASDGPRRSRSVSRRSALAAVGTAFVSATAGCAAFRDDDADESDADPAADAPADATALARFDLAAIAAEDDADRVLEDLAAAEESRVAAATTRFEARTGLDPLEADELLLFEGPEESDDGAGTAGTAIVDADWTEDEVADSLADATGLEYESATYLDEPILYEPAESSAGSPEGTEDEPDGSSPDPAVLGILDDGRYVVGDADPVRASLDVRYGDADPVSGRIRDAYDDAAGGQLTVASAASGPLIPEEYRALAGNLNLEVFEEVEAVGRRYAVVADGIALDLSLYVDEEREAEELETVITGALAALADLDEEFAEAREDVVLERDETVVEVSYEGRADVVFALLDGV